ELCGLFLSEGPRMLREIREALAVGDPVGVRQSAHGLKGAAGYVGGSAVAAAASRLERLSEARELGTATEVFRVLETEVGRLTFAFAAAGNAGASPAPAVR